MYNGSRKWGSVRVTTKRSKSLISHISLCFNQTVFPEQHKYKKSMKKERAAYRQDLVQDDTIQYSIVVKAQSPRKKMTAIIEPEKV